MGAVIRAHSSGLSTEARLRALVEKYKAYDVISEADSYGMTPLHIAVMSRECKMVRHCGCNEINQQKLLTLLCC